MKIFVPFALIFLRGVLSAPTYQESRFARIVNGTDMQGPLPYMVSIEKQYFYPGVNTHFCGGAIVSEKYVITTALCARFGLQPSKVRVRVGAYLLPPSIEGQTINVKAFIYPTNENGDQLDVPNGYSSSMDNDLVLMELEESITFSDNVWPVGLPADSSYAPANGTLCAISGWGVVQEHPYSRFDRRLHYAMIPIVDDCGVTESGEPLDNLTENMFCAGGQDGTGFCDYDEGGPLVCQGPDDSMILAGLASFNRPEPDCGEYPGIFTKVTNYLPFIQGTI